MGKGENVVTMQDVKNRKMTTVEWDYVEYKKDGSSYPLKIWENLEKVLIYSGIEVKYNLINHEIDYPELEGGSLLRNGKATDIYSLQIKEGLNLSRAESNNGIIRIAEKYSYNPFVDMLEKNENENYELIDKVFDCLEINKDFINHIEYYSKIFTKWVINVVKMAHNTLDNNYSSQGVLVLQGGQGTFKSTFCRELMPDVKWFKGDESLDPEKTDSIIKNTSYILVEWGELDSTLKGEQAKLKQYITATNDEYRSPYAQFAEKYPRVTSYIGTVNKADFLKDETGSRRFWIIPVEKCDIKKLKEIDIQEFWGAVYSLWKTGLITEFLEPQDLIELNQINKTYAYENDITIVLNEKLNWDTLPEEWEVYNISEICEYLYIREKKSLKIELEKKGIKYQSYRMRNGQVKKGFKIPKITINYNL